MGILTHVSSSYDDDLEMQRVFAVTKFAPSNRSSLNRVAGRVVVMTGAGHRSLVSAAYDELGIDMVWRDGPFTVLDPEEKYPDAQKMNFKVVNIEDSSSFGEIAHIPDEAFPRGKLADFFVEGLDVFNPQEKVLMVWEIPKEVGGRDL